MNTDGDLLRRFAETRDEACFAQVVERHIRFVHAVSLRRLRDAHAAEDATQAVFIALARKARAVAKAPSLLGWLHRSACYETRNLMRAQINRIARETEAQRLGTTASESSSSSDAVEALLDEVLCALSQSDREAILARFFEGQSYAAIGAAQQLTENAARMRVDRALTRLRDQFRRRGVKSTAAVLAKALPGYAAVPIPDNLIAAVTKAAVPSLAGVTGVAAIINFMSTIKVITGVALSVLVGGLFYQHRVTSRLAADLSSARAESLAASQQLQAIQREIAGLKQSKVAAAPTPAVQPSTAGATTGATPPLPLAKKAPQGWFKNGSANELYEVGVDDKNPWGGMPSAYVKSTGTADGKFGGMMQTISADTYKNQRVRLTGWVKTADAANGGHLWMRVDGQGTNMLQFDNMDGREPKGTTDWEEYSIVLDVPPEAVRLNYGFFVAGEGQMWVNGLTITPVGTNTPTTKRLNKQPPLPQTPVNLGFAPPKPQ